MTLPQHGETMGMLELQDVHTYYGNIQAIKGISLTSSRARS